MSTTRNLHVTTIVRRLASWIAGVALFVSASPTFATTPSFLWSKTWGGPVENIGAAVAVDASGNVILAGMFDGTLNLGGSTLTTTGGYDVFLAKFDANGNHLWSQRFGDAAGNVGHQTPNDVAVDASGNIYLTGTYVGTSNFGGANLPVFSSLFSDVFLAKYNANGVHQWSKGFGGTAADYATGIAVNASSVCITGSFAGSINFGGGAQSSLGSIDAFVAAFDQAGTYQWSRVYGNNQSDQANDVAFDPSGNVLVCGRVGTSVNFGGGALTYQGGASDIFLLKLNSAGTHVWSKDTGGVFSEEAFSVGVDGSSNVIVAGDYSNSTDLGGGAISSPDNYNHVVLAKYSSSGAYQWGKGFVGTGLDHAASVVVTSAGNIALTGSFGAFPGYSGYTINLGGATFTSAGDGDIFIAGFNTSGTHQWSAAYGGPLADDGRMLAFDASGANLLLTGQFQNNVTFLYPTHASAGLNDIYVVKYATQAAEPAVQSIVDVKNDQGRNVRIKFSPSGLDGAGRAVPIVRYDAYRRDKAAPPSAARGGAGAAPGGPVLDTGWQFVASVPAHGETTYLMGVPTIGDSTVAHGPYYSSFFVRAATNYPQIFYDSPVDSGYSLDNLAPSVPSSFVYTPGSLSWNASTDEDVDHYTVYGSSRAVFDATAVVIARTREVRVDVSDAPFAYYFVTAFDRAGNESNAAHSGGAPGVTTPAHYVLAVGSYPNPFNPRTTVSYSVPSRGHVNVSVYDAGGTLVVTLFDGERNVGAYSVDWDGRTAGASFAASGIYFARIEHAGAVRSAKMVLLK